MMKRRMKRKKLRYMALSDKKKEEAVMAGKDAMQDAYEKSKQHESLKWWERLIWVVVAGVAAAVTSLLTGCGHDVVMTPDGTTVSKDGAVLVMQPGFLSFAQEAPAPVEEPVVIVQQGK